MDAPGFLGRSYVSGALSRATRSIVVGLGRRLADLGLGFGQYLVLVRLWRAWPRPLAQADLVVDLSVERSSMSTLLGSIERDGLVCRHGDPVDGRRLLVSLTERGRALEAPVLDVVERYESELLAGLSTAELAQLVRLLGMVQARASDLRAAAPLAEPVQGAGGAPAGAGVVSVDSTGFRARR